MRILFGRLFFSCSRACVCNMAGSDSIYIYILLSYRCIRVQSATAVIGSRDLVAASSRHRRTPPYSGIRPSSATARAPLTLTHTGAHKYIIIIYITYTRTGLSSRLHSCIYVVSIHIILCVHIIICIYKLSDLRMYNIMCVCV